MKIDKSRRSKLRSRNISQSNSVDNQYEERPATTGKYENVKPRYMSPSK